MLYFFNKHFALLAVSAIPLFGNEELMLKVKSTFNDNLYEIVITKGEIAKTPRWEEHEECPPLSLRSAERSAREYLKNHVPKSEHFALTKIVLQPADFTWIYRLEFIPFMSKADVLLGPPNNFIIPVLMNGRIPLPKVSPARPGKATQRPSL